MCHVQPALARLSFSSVQTFTCSHSGVVFFHAWGVLAKTSKTTLRTVGQVDCPPPPSSLSLSCSCCLSCCPRWSGVAPFSSAPTRSGGLRPKQQQHFLHHTRERADQSTTPPSTPTANTPPGGRRPPTPATRDRRPLPRHRAALLLDLHRLRGFPLRRSTLTPPLTLRDEEPPQRRRAPPPVRPAAGDRVDQRTGTDHRSAGGTHSARWDDRGWVITQAVVVLRAHSGSVAPARRSCVSWQCRVRQRRWPPSVHR